MEFLRHFVCSNSNCKNQEDDGEEESYWRAIKRAVCQSPSGNELRNMACVDVQVDLSSPTGIEHQQSPKDKVLYHLSLQ